ncbi:MAG: glycosyltransferase [Lachnospiraceae bacterium]|nr:glycosyltransferase [Lachnospiraceae bacterium]
MKTVDVIIPTYKPDQKFMDLMDRLKEQTVPIRRIIIINTGRKYFDRLTDGTSFSGRYNNILVKHIAKREFDHGSTRNKAVGYSDAEIFIMMTQDAVPADEFMVEKLLEALDEKNVAVAYGRQLADKSSTEAEKFTRNFNYPAQKAVKTKADLDRLGIKTFFCSNVCAAYKRDIFDALGGFINHTIFNEDMIFAAGAVFAGYGIAYQPEARVYHSHDYTAGEQFRRYFDLGVSQADHPEIFAKVPSESEGMKLFMRTVAHLSRKKMIEQIPGVIIQTGFKYLGYLAGKNYRKLPKKLVVRCSANRRYWE